MAWWAAWRAPCPASLPGCAACSVALEHSVTLEDWRALLDEGAGRFLVVLGLASADHARRLAVEGLRQRALLRHLHVLLHMPPGDARAGRELLGEAHGLVVETGIVDHPVGQPQFLDLVGVQNLGGEVELARLRGADQLVQEIMRAEIAGEAH